MIAFRNSTLEFSTYGKAYHIYFSQPTKWLSTYGKIYYIMGPELFTTPPLSSPLMEKISLKLVPDQRVFLLPGFLFHQFDSLRGGRYKTMKLSGNQNPITS